MTNKEIIQALECCKSPIGSGACNSCPYNATRNNAMTKHDTKFCSTVMFEDVIDLIKRQRRRIKKLKAEIKAVQKYLVQRKALEDMLNELEKDLEKESED